jgi:hypothetical protein
MLTNIGKNILAKYLIGQTQSYASHISFGCGPRPLSTASALGDYSAKTSLDFEMFRSPIISRGYVTEYLRDVDGEISVDPTTGLPLQFSQIVLTAQMPTPERYEITEVGLYPAVSNPSAGNSDSKIVSSFANTENWQHHTDTSQILSIPLKQESLDKVNGVLPPDAVEGAINVAEKVFYANSDNAVLDSDIRLNRNERPRFLNSSLFLRGDLSETNFSNSVISPVADAAHVRLSNATSLRLDRNSAQDELKVAFSLINKNNNSTDPSEVRLVIEFANSESSDAPYARLQARITSDLSQNRYFLISQKLEDLQKSSNFVWGAVTTVKAYVSVIVGGQLSSDYYVALDGLRLENLTAQNPLYGLTGYTVVRTENGRPLIKSDRTNNLMEFRFAMDVN